MPSIPTRMNDQNIYKYRLHELFIARFGKESAAMKKLFCEQYSWSMRTVDNDFALTIGNSECIPTWRVIDYCLFLKLADLSELRNQKQAA